MNTRDEVAMALARSHSAIEPAVAKIVRLISDREDQPDEPIKLLESNPDTVPSGIVPIFFGPSDGIPYATIVVEVTPQEFEQVEKSEIDLPDGWKRGEVLFEREMQD